MDSLLGGGDEEERLFGEASEMGGFPEVGIEEFEDSGKVSKREKLAKKKAKSGGFESMNLSRPIFMGIKRKGYNVPTPIQRKTLPVILAGRDVVAMARTGSGKTAAFLIPMLEKLQAHSLKGGCRAVILSPTRELAMQTFKFSKELGRFTDLRSALLVGGDTMEGQFEELAKNPDILIATPGRLMHLLSEVEGMTLKAVQYVVFDEADRLFEMGFQEQLRQILQRMPEARQTLLFSATLPRLLAEFARAGLHDPELIRLDIEARISPDLSLVFFTARQEEKPAVLLHLLTELIREDQQTIVFVATRHHVEFLNELLSREGIQASVVYGTMDQTARKIHIAKFRARKTMLLMVTDVAARGIDIPLLDNVINYDFPAKPKLFVHRVGRAARAGRTGTAYSIIMQEEAPYMLDLHLYLGRRVRPAPNAEANGGIGGESVSQGAARETVYGRLPQKALDFGLERVRDLLASAHDLQGLQKSASNAYRLYAKTRPAPSTESVKRAKGLGREGIHPIFANALADSENALMAFAEQLKAFRPKQTVLEAEAEAAKSKKKTMKADLKEIMRKKREVHTGAIAAARRQKEEAEAAKAEEEEREEEDAAAASPPPSPSLGATVGGKRKRKAAEVHGEAATNGGNVKKKKRKALLGSFRDEENYISSVPQNRFAEQQLMVGAGGEPFAQNRMETAVLDLVPDDQAGIQKKRATYHWDKKKKRYIRLQPGELVSASGKVKTESGARVNPQSRGIYKRWQQRTHMRVSADGQDADMPTSTDGGVRRGGHAARGSHANGRGRRKLPNAHVRDELKGVEEVRKKRQKKAVLEMRRGKKGGRGGSSQKNGSSRGGYGRQEGKKGKGGKSFANKSKGRR